MLSPLPYHFQEFNFKSVLGGRALTLIVVFFKNSLESITSAFWSKSSAPGRIHFKTFETRSCGEFWGLREISGCSRFVKNVD